MTIQKNLATFQNPALEPDGAMEELPKLDLGDILRVVRTHKKIIFGTAFLVIVLTGLAISLLTPLYTATASVVLDQRQNNVIDANAVVSGLVANPPSILNQAQILQSRNLAAQVVDKLNLMNDPEFNPPPDAPSIIPAWLNVALMETAHWANPANWFGENAPAPAAPPTLDDQKNAVINTFLAKLFVTPLGLSSTITVSFQSIDAAKAALITNTIVDAYVKDQVNAKFEATQKASQWLSERIQQVATQTQASEHAVEQYKADHNLTDTATPGTSVVAQQLGAVNIQLVSAQADLAQQEAKYGQVIAMQKSGHAADVSQVVSSPLISQLRQQETDLLRQEADLSSRYGPRHPKVLDLESQKKNLSGKIDEEVGRIILGIAGDVEVARARVRSLQDNLSHTASQSQGENLARVKLSELTAAATSNRALYDTFLSQFKEIEGKDTVQAPDARVISGAARPAAPSFPKKTIFLGAASVGGLLLGIMLAMLSDSMDSGFRTRAQVERTLSLPVLASLPEVRRFSRSVKNVADCIINKPRSTFAEAMRGLQLGLVLGNGNKAPKIIVVTSSVPSEGKTTVAVSLARIAARSGQRVILMDADFRQPSVAKATGIPRSATPGIADLLDGKVLLENCIVKDPISDVLLLPVGGHVSNPSDLLASNEMANLLTTLSACSDLLIIDSSPLLPVNDARILARLADSVVFVVRWERTPRAASLHALRSLTDAMAPLAGIVLARTDSEQFRYENYGRQSFHSFRRYYEA